ncbi:MAG: dTMP kinase [Elusimicrobia bacterium]|nr:dTMP kinase [Elusimicrobiota bacterium]
MKRGVFITLEGSDGCGKTTQTVRLKEKLARKGLKVAHTREPGGTSFAENLRQIILNPKNKISPVAELLLYEASRVQHTQEILLPALRQGKIVLCERYTDATVAYQGYGRKINPRWIEDLNRMATGGLTPDLTILLDIPVEEGLKRARKSGGKRGDRLERENLLFHRRVRRGYVHLARREPQRIKVVSARGTVAEVEDKIENVLRSKFPQWF